jgi:hypothetical protein
MHQLTACGDGTLRFDDDTFDDLAGRRNVADKRARLTRDNRGNVEVGALTRGCSMPSTAVRRLCMPKSASPYAAMTTDGFPTHDGANVD